MAGRIRLFGIASLALAALASTPGQAGPSRAQAQSNHEFRDRAGIEDVIVGLANAVDARNWGAAKALLADQVQLEYHAAGGDAPIKQRMTPDQFIAASKLTLPGYLHTQHLIGNLVITVRGKSADAASQVWMSHYLPNDQGEPYWIAAGTYHHQLVRTRTGWKISAMRVTVLYELGNSRLPKLAGERVKAGTIMTTP